MTTAFYIVSIKFRAMQKQCGLWAAIRWAKNQGLSLDECLLVVKLFGVK